MILDPLVVIISNMPSIWVTIFELLFIILNLIRVIFTALCMYYHFKQYDGASPVFTELKLKEFHELEAIYVESGMSTGI